MTQVRSSPTTLEKALINAACDSFPSLSEKASLEGEKQLRLENWEENRPCQEKQAGAVEEELAQAAGRDE